MNVILSYVSIYCLYKSRRTLRQLKLIQNLIFIEMCSFSNFKKIFFMT